MAAIRDVAAVASACAAGLALVACGAGPRQPAARTAARAPASPPTRPAARPLRSAAGTCRRDGVFRVATAHVALRRRSAVTGRIRRIDPSAWFPAATRKGGPVGGCRFPLVLFSHGAGERPSRYSLLLRSVAASGFVVLAPHHPDRQDDARTASIDRPADLAFLLDHLGAVARRLAPSLPGEIDATRVAVVGHSFGGFAAAELAGRDRRVRALVMLAGFGPRSVARAVRVPTLALAGAHDGLVPPSSVAAFVSGLPASTPRRLVVLPRADHQAYGDGCREEGTCAAVARDVIGFLRRTLAGRPSY